MPILFLGGWTHTELLPTQWPRGNSVSFSSLLLFCLLFKQAIFVSPIPATAGIVLAIEWSHLDLITIVSVHGVNRGCQVFLAVFYYRRSRGKLTLFRGHIWIPLEGHFLPNGNWMVRLLRR